MAKLKKAFFCKSCGQESAKWLGRCPACGEWNSFVEEVISKPTTSAIGLTRTQNSPQLLDEIDSSCESRIDLGSKETNRILGGGLVRGSMILIGGEPGIGKSTLGLQLALNRSDLKTFYVSGEESAQQIKLRAARLGGGDNAQCYIISETLLETIIRQALELKPDILIIDSIQTLYSERIESSAGSISQIRDCSVQLLKFAKETNTPIFIIGHITKDGALAGPKVLEHIVDVVLQFEGDRNHMYRLLRATKNRFGSTAEIGIFEMQSNGLKEVENPSEILISQHNEILSGVAIAATMDGVRPLFIETQALVSTAAYGTPQRSTTGIDSRRLNMLLAVLEKRAGFRLAVKDVFTNIAGGLHISDTAIDMAVVCAVMSSNIDEPIPLDYCFCGEVGLTGELRPVPHIDQRITEASRLGFKKIFISKYNKRSAENAKIDIEVISVAKIEELMRALFGKKE